MFDYSFLDFETANKSMSSACAVGMVSVRDGYIVDLFSSYIKAENFDSENVMVHGIRASDVHDAPSFSDVLPRIIRRLKESRIIIAHNAQFDMSVLQQSAAAAGLSVPDFFYADSIRYLSYAAPDCGHSLADYAAFYGVSIEGHHDPLRDCIILAQISERALAGHSMESLLCRSKDSIRAFSLLNANESFAASSKKTGSNNPKFHSYFRANANDLVADTSKADPNHPLYGKNVVFTGDMERIKRKDAMQLVLDAGAVVKSSVSKKTDFVILGKQDPEIVGADGMSTKERKAHELIESGHPLRIIREPEFLEMFKLR